MEISATGYCKHHDPERREQVRAEQRLGAQRGGKMRALKDLRERAGDVPPPPTTLDEAVAYAAWAVHAVATGRIDGRTGHEILYGLNIFKTAVKDRDIAREIKAMRERLDALTNAPRPKLKSLK
jgi:hypothetical protein